MISTPLIEMALDIASMAHAGQLDKAGVPYINHPIHLAEQCETEAEIVVALLHDVIEDHPEYRNHIYSLGLSYEVLEAIDILNRNSPRYLSSNKRMTYNQYIKSVATNKLATKIKILDLEHNMDETRGAILPITLRERYVKAHKKLKSVK